MFFRYCIVGFLLTLGSFAVLADEHPSIFITAAEATEIRSNLSNYPVLQKSFDLAMAEVEKAMQHDLEIPPPGEAGGYEHEKHKQNYREMRNAGLLFTITGDEKYALFVKNMLRSYADIYPDLGPHPLSYKQSPGKIFHQTLNEAVWLVYASIAYDCIYDWLDKSDREYMEKRLFYPMANWFSERNAAQFNRIHNHGTWTCASVGMIGYVMGDQELVDRAIYGTERNETGGFLKQLDLLFSPDGYYMEGPYYIRYALRPFFLFADAIQRKQPELGIYKHRNGILKKVLLGAVQTSYPNGIFPPINDASRTMDVRAPGVLFATDLAYRHYGSDENLLAIASIQDQVILNGAGLKVASALTQNRPELSWPSVEFRDGSDGLRGGLGILRTGSGEKQSMLLMKYGVHGLGHGHFDKLQLMFFDQGNEVLPDYGFARWINMEPKFGGRYLPENNSYAKQTIAHNTVVVNGISQNKGKRKAADAVWAERHFFSIEDPDVQVMSARANLQYEDTEMQRTVFLLNNSAFEHPIVIDLFRLKSAKMQQYDYPVHYRGQIITTSKVKAAREKIVSLGDVHGYQHIWKTGEAKTDSLVQLTWLLGNRYYSVSTAASPGTQVLTGRVGANDPDFNLRSEPMILIRRNAKSHLFASVIEPHGFFNEAGEKSRNARSSIFDVRVVGHSDAASVVEVVKKDGNGLRVLLSNKGTGNHSVDFNGKTYRWNGQYSIEKLIKTTK
ncbi:MAG: heparinase II/III domain-containing protein [Calditrichia bacterium]